jgi:uncharacterized protein (TIGR00290 family)
LTTAFEGVKLGMLCGKGDAGVDANEPIVHSWSGGKDSCMSLAEICRDGAQPIAGLLSTVTERFERVSMHGVRLALLKQQATALGLRLDVVYIPQDATNEVYQSRMAEVLGRFLRQGVRTVAFGDLFLADIREYRERWLSQLGIRAIFPLWQRDTAQLAQSFVDRQFEAIVTCVDSRVLDRSFAGRPYDRRFLRDLPAGVDPCGENGEFHTFVIAGPNFHRAVRVRRGEVILRDFWYFCDLLPE